MSICLSISISSNFENELIVIRNKFKLVGYPQRFTDTVFCDFQRPKTSKEIDYIIPPWIFEPVRKIILLEIPFCEKMNMSPSSLSKSIINLQIKILMFVSNG